MDHKVSKDMISSGMIPSGEKTQADLGRTQYGSAPSPSKLMDAYKSMYKEENIDEMLGDGGTKPPAGKTYRVKSGADGGSREVRSTYGKPQEGSFITRQKEKLEAQRAGTDVQGLRDKKKKEAEAAKDRVIKANAPRTGIDPRKGKAPVRQMDARNLSNPKFENVDLLAAYNAVYEHHKKDADGNTIPHEDEEVNEGKIPAGLQAYLDKKKGKKEDKKDMKEEVDKFDVVFNHFISEGYSEKEAYAKMANLTEEQLDEFLKALAQAGMRGAQSIGKSTQGLAARAAQQGANLGQKKPMDVISPVKRKPFDAQPTPRKPFDAKKPEPKIGDDNFRAKTASDVVTSINMKRKKEREITPNKGQVMQDEYQYVNEIAQFIPMLAKGAAAVGKALKPVATAAKKVVKNPTVQNLATQTAVGAAMNSGGQQKQRTGTVSASADLFDIVKGQLLDEGLSEEEIKDIMLTLTPDEIMKEIEESSMSDGSAGGAYQDLGPGGFRSREQINRMHNDPKGTEKYGKKIMKRVGQAVRDTGTPTVRKVDESKK